MTELFLSSKRKDFDGLETWDTSNVTTMAYMFLQAEHFNHLIECWDVSKVRDMLHMFSEASAFDQPLDRWDVSKVKKMDYMFREAASFRQPVTAWRLRDQSPRHIFLRSPRYGDMESRVMCLAALDVNSREYDLQEMVKIFGAKAVCDALLQYGAEYGAEYGAAECVEYVKSHYADELKA